MRIAGLVKNSTVDFPERLSAVVFVPGCNYVCYYCHNKHLLKDPPVVDEAAVWGFLEKRRGLLDGVVFTGGEPTLQPELPAAVRRAKAMGYDVKLDTNGSNPAVVQALLDEGALTYVALDYKAPFAMYASICGAGPQGVRETLALLLADDIEWELRTTVVPQLTRERMVQMARDIPAVKRYALQLYRAQPVDLRCWEGCRPYTPRDLDELLIHVQAHQPNAFVRA